MKLFLFILLTCGSNFALLAQIEVGVWTDKPTYDFGDTIAITITAYNPTSDTVILSFTSSCQANYIIDDFNFYGHIGCLTVLTSQTIPPFRSFSWDYLKYPYGNSGWPLLSAGSHSVIGEVLGYGKSDTLLIVVTPVTSVSRDNSRTSSFLLGQNYPNPFNGETTIPFTIPNASRVVIALYNSLGQRMRTLLDDHLVAGSHLIRTELGDLPSGLYWCRLQADGRNQTRKLVLLK